MILHSEEVRSVIHQTVDQLYDNGTIIMESKRIQGRDIFTVKLCWLGMKISLADMIVVDNQNPS